MSKRRPITIFTPSFADGSDTNAQNLTVKELVARLPEDDFRVAMICQGSPDPRIAARRNTQLLPYFEHGNAARLLSRCVFARPDIYFFPRCGPLDRAFFDIKKYLRLRTKLITYIVMEMNASTHGGLIGRSIVEADCICANSYHVADSVLQEFGRQAEVVHDGVDGRSFFPLERVPSDKLVVLYAGSFQARKRVELIVEQAARLRDVEFRLAGKGETESVCRGLCEKYNCRNVTFLGHLSSTELGAEMRAADVFLFPSILEGNPQVLLQAAACGLPCIAMGLYRPDYVLHGKTGFLLQSDSELPSSLGLLLEDSGLRRSMSEAAVLHARNFDWDRIVEQWSQIFERVVAISRAAVS